MSISDGATHLLLTFGGDADNLLMGDFHRNSSKDMLVRSSEGRTFGDGAVPPPVAEVDLGDLADQFELPARSPETGTAASPDEDIPMERATGLAAIMAASASCNPATPPPGLIWRQLLDRYRGSFPGSGNSQGRKWDGGKIA